MKRLIYNLDKLGYDVDKELIYQLSPWPHELSLVFAVKFQ